MTFRDVVSLVALSRLADSLPPESLARRVYEIADAVIEVRERGPRPAGPPLPTSFEQILTGALEVPYVPKKETE